MVSQIILSKALGLNKSLPNVVRLIASRNFVATTSNNSILVNNKQQTTLKRNICSEATLGMEKLYNMRESRGKIYSDGKERYIERLDKFLKQGDTKSIFRDDLVNLIALAENSQHLDMIEQIAINSKDDSSGSLGNWGSAVMRLYYSLNEIDRAYENLKDVEKFGEFFNQRTSYQVLMTMLFKAARYEQVIEIYELSTSRLNNLDPAVVKNPTDRRLTIIAFAAYCKMNTPEALEAANRLFAKDPHNQILKARTVSFLAYLALNQNEPVMALNLLSDHPNKNYITAREIKTISLLKLKRYEDILYHLKDSLNVTRRDVKMLLEENYQLLKSSLNEIEDEQVRSDLDQTLAALKEENLVGADTLESVVFNDIDRRPREDLPVGGGTMQFNRQRRFDGSANYRPNQGNRDDNFSGFRSPRPNYSRYRDDADSSFSQPGPAGNQMQQQGRRNWQGNRNFDNNQRRGRPQAKSYLDNDDEDLLDDMSEFKNSEKRFR